MKKFIFIILCTACVHFASAQVATPTKREAQKDMRKDVKDLKAERKDRNTKIAHAQFKKAAVQQHEIKQDRKDLNANKKHLKNKGVAAPKAKVKAQVKGQD